MLEPHTLPVELEATFRGYVEYILMKQEIAHPEYFNRTGVFSDAGAVAGLRLILALIIRFPSVWRGYRNHRWLEQTIEEHLRKGDDVVLSESGRFLVLKVRER